MADQRLSEVNPENNISCPIKSLYFLKMCNGSNFKPSDLTKYKLVNISTKFDRYLLAH